MLLQAGSKIGGKRQSRLDISCRTGHWRIFEGITVAPSRLD